LLKADLGLNGLSASEANLVDHGELATGSITKDGAAAKLLGSEVIALGGELTSKEGGFVL
jgi:hypothetical protein